MVLKGHFVMDCFTGLKRDLTVGEDVTTVMINIDDPTSIKLGFMAIRRPEVTRNWRKKMITGDAIAMTHAGIVPETALFG